MPADRILECPFCGGTPDISETDDGLCRWVFCPSCEADGPPIDYRFSGTKEESRKIVIDRWNLRTGTVYNGKTAAEWYTMYCQEALRIRTIGSHPVIVSLSPAKPQS